MMESIFRKDPTSRAPTVLERIGPEISHLQKGGATAREGARTSKIGAWIAALVLLSLLALFLMDPFLYSFNKSEAIRAYLYLHNYDSTAATDALVKSGMFSKAEVRVMSERHGAYQSYFSTPDQAEASAASIVAFMNGLHDLHNGHYEKLDTLGKLRYLLFVRNGLHPPSSWSMLNPTIE